MYWLQVEIVAFETHSAFAKRSRYESSEVTDGGLRASILRFFPSFDLTGNREAFFRNRTLKALSVEIFLSLPFNCP